MLRSPERNRVNYLSHRSIFEAIVERDPDAAERALQSHLGAAWEYVRGTFESPMVAEYDHIVIGGGAAGCVAASRLVQAGRRVLLLEAGHSHHHPLLDMPPGIFKMINGSKFMRYHRTTPQEHLDGRVHEISQGNVLGGGTSVNAQVYMRGRPSDYDEWDSLLRGNNSGVRWDWEHVLPHFRGMEGNNRLYDERHNSDGTAACLRPGLCRTMSRAGSCRACRASVCPSHTISTDPRSAASAYTSS